MKRRMIFVKSSKSMMIFISLIFAGCSIHTRTNNSQNDQNKSTSGTNQLKSEEKDFVNPEEKWYVVSPDTNKWHPDEIYIVYPNIRLKIKLPYENDQSGLANIFFHCKETDVFHQLDTIYDNKLRKYTQFIPGKYEIILLYNDGKYIKSDEIIIEAQTSIDLDLDNHNIQPPCFTSQYWLYRRSMYDVVVFDWRDKERLIWNNYTSDSANKIRGYLFSDLNGAIIPNVGRISLDVSDGFRKTTISSCDGYFEIDVEKDVSQTLRISMPGHHNQEININANSILFIVLEDDNTEVIIAGGQKKGGR